MSDQTEAIIEQRMGNLQSKMTAREKPVLTEDQKRIQKENKILELRTAWNAPKRQRERLEIDRSGPWGKCEQKLLGMLESGFCVALIGGRGPGKTQMGVELMRTVTERAHSAFYSSAVGFFLAIKASYKPTSELTEEDVIERFAKYALLVVDEVGQRAETEWEDRMFFEMLDRRYRAVKDTILISNQEADKFTASIGDSLASRMNETGGIIECNWPSFRDR